MILLTRGLHLIKREITSATYPDVDQRGMCMIRIFSSILFLVMLITSATFVAPSSAYADDIIIQDSSGTVRAQGSLDSASDGSVTLTATDSKTGKPAEDGTAIVLTPIGGGAAITGTTIGGEVIFTGLAAGTYTVASTSAITFTGVSIAAGTTAMAAAGGAAGGAAVVGGTGAAVAGTSVAAAAVGVAAVGTGAAIAIDESNSGNNDAPLSPIR